MAFFVGVGLLFCLWCLYVFLPHILVLIYLSAARNLHNFELSMLRSGKMQKPLFYRGGE